mmetsp:Transcript_51094/g.115105  ORF Transcript_51094/g.115105 Transcript_51094/m.115105 type:complete len:640 (+) Transcript_51094:110-2029(+)
MLWRDLLLLCGGFIAAVFVVLTSVQEGESIPEFFAHIDVGYSAADFDIALAEEWLHEVLAASTTSATIFDVLDSNKDGYVAEDELQRLLQERPESLMHAVHGEHMESSEMEEESVLAVPEKLQQQEPVPKATPAPSHQVLSPGAKDTLIPPDVPIYMEWKDVQEYPHAGLLLPCLTRNDTDSTRPDMKSMPSCAVVGQSAGLLGSKFGAMIDKHSHVFRTGVCAPDELSRLKGDLGQRTTFCIAFTLGVKLDSKGARLLLVPKTGWKAFDPGGVRRNWPLCHRQWLVVHPDMVTAVDNLLNDWGEMPPLPERSPLSWREASTLSNPSCMAYNTWSTGCLGGKCPGCEDMIDVSAEFYATVLATTLCQEVVLYGFDLNMSGDAPYTTIHTITRRLPKSKVKDQKPALPLERHLLRIFKKRGLIQIHDTPAPSASHEKLGEVIKLAKHDGYDLLGSGICTAGHGKGRIPPGRVIRQYVKAREGEIEAERVCNRSATCTGYQFNPETQSYQLMRQPIDDVLPDDGEDLMCYAKRMSKQQLAAKALSASAASAGGYRYVGQGRCGKRIYESLAVKLDRWIPNKERRQAELMCNRTAVCKGYQWRSMDNAYLLLSEQFDATCCWVATRPEACYMKEGVSEGKDR